MTNSKELFDDLVKRITLPEDKSEIQSIVYVILESKYKLTKTDILSGKEVHIADSDSIDAIIQRVNKEEPIQYILGEASFFGRLFSVNSSVLIPRPETELLVEEIKHFTRSVRSPISILDIGTGSGCIGISLALEIPNSIVSALDISPRALACAKKNASTLGANINLIELDILNQELTDQFDLIVSNPPYIAIEEKMTMNKNVLAYEPHLALFAPENDPLIFYRTIAKMSTKILAQKGSAWMEINERFGKEVGEIFHEQGYNQVRILKDLDGKERIVWAMNL